MLKGDGHSEEDSSSPLGQRSHNCVRWARPSPDDGRCKDTCRRHHFNYFEWWPEDVCYCCKIFDKE